MSEGHRRGAQRIGRIVERVLSEHSRPAAPPITSDAWFLGGHAENEALLRKLVDEVIGGHVSNRRAYAPDDPDLLYENDFETEAFKATERRLIEGVRGLSDMLKGSIPLSSYRNQSHMYWDITLPGIAGYLAGMLHNQNQAAAEASPVTTALEYAVGQQLCEMLGYDPDGEIMPWGHITVGGSIANVEALWAARNLRFQGAALAHAVRTEEALAPAANVTVHTADGRRERLATLSEWDVLNIPVDEMLALPRRVAENGGLPDAVVSAALDRHSIQAVGVLDFFRSVVPTTPPPVMMVPATAHYSWPRGAGISGLGIRQIWPIEVDADGRMQTSALRRTLDRCLDEKRPVVMVAAVIGSTTESAVDPIAEIAGIRDEYREMGLDFALHADAAWGGYFASILRPPKLDGAESPEARLGGYVERQLAALGKADTITVDPHKAGFIPYPAGALCYRHSGMPGLITVVADIVYHGGDAMTMGACALAGSSPGASTTSVYLSHLCIPPDRSGYGRLLGRCLFNAKRFYASLVTMATEADPFIIVPFKRLPAEAAGGTPVEIERQIERIRSNIVGLNNRQVLANLEASEDLRQLFDELGPDLTVFNYAFNFRTADGLNSDPVLMNELNMDIFRACSIEENPDHVVPPQELFLTQHRFSPSVHGQSFCDAFASRLGVVPEPGLPVDFLVSTIQNPWLTETSDGNFIPDLTEILRGIVTDCVASLVARHGLRPMTKSERTWSR